MGPHHTPPPSPSASLSASLRAALEAIPSGALEAVRSPDPTRVPSRTPGRDPSPPPPQVPQLLECRPALVPQILECRPDDPGKVCVTCADEAVPVRVLQLLGNGMAMVDTGESMEEVSVALVSAQAGDTVLVHAKEAIAMAPLPEPASLSEAEGKSR